MRNDVAKFIETLNRKAFIAFAYLFGSRVKNHYSNRSDWDIAIYFSDSPKNFDILISFELEAELSRALYSNVQVIVLNKRLPSPVFGFQIVSEGIVLIERDENLRLEFENRVLRQYYDWQYFLKRQIEAEKGT